MAEKQICFGDIVVVEKELIGVVVKSWQDGTHDVYVRMYNGIKSYNEEVIDRYMVRHKYLDEQEIEWQQKALAERSEE